jgi:CheY-like chemotaxis protein
LGNKTILLVEDSLDDAVLALRAFKQNNMGIEIVLVNDGLQALDYLHGTGSFEGRNLAMPGLILLDLNLPKLDGFELLLRLRTDGRMKHLPVVVLTTSTEDHIRTKAYRFGATSYMRKPAEFQKLVELTRLLSVYWLELNEPAPT